MRQSTLYTCALTCCKDCQKGSCPGHVAGYGCPGRPHYHEGGSLILLVHVPTEEESRGIVFNEMPMAYAQRLETQKDGGQE